MSVIGDKHIAFVKLWLDEDAENPLCGSGNRIVSLNKRHSNFDPVAFDKYHRDPDSVVLGYYEHGDCTWHVSGNLPTGTESDYSWDGVWLAGIWIPGAETRKYVLHEVGELSSEARRRRALQNAEDDCSVYSAWCNGHVYGYSVTGFVKHYFESDELHDRELDYRKDEPVMDINLGGIYFIDGTAYLLRLINADLAELT